jgi:hypothetical protein
MKLTFSKVIPIGLGAWIAPLSPNDARRFSQNSSSKGGRSVIGVEAPRYESKTGTLTTAFDMIVTLNVGESEEAVFIDLKPQDVMPQKAIVPKKQDAKELPIASCDQKFIASCRKHLPDHMTEIIIEVLKQIRKHHDFELTEGNSRNWTSSPSNFVSITIQTRNKQFKVSVKGDPSDYSLKHIQPKINWSPYCAFHLNSQSQIDETVKMILNSAKY